MSVKKTIFSGLFILCSILAYIYYCYNTVEKVAKNYVYDQMEKLPSCKVGLLLGTTKLLSNGQQNLYFTYRIEAAVNLMENNKIEKIILSGDNSSKEYDEPNDMRTALIEKGIDSNKIILDYAGFRTFDSMIRLKEIFGQTTAIVISQRFHNERAIYIGKKIGLKVYGYNAKDVNQYYGFKTQVREHLARVKMMLDFIFGAKPKFLGKKIVI